MNLLIYRGSLHPLVYSLFDEKRHNVSVTTIKILCDGLEISLAEFFDSSEFDSLEQELH